MYSARRNSFVCNSSLVIERSRSSSSLTVKKDGSLRRLVKAHPVRLHPKQFCALCGTNTRNPRKLRPRPNSPCGTCSVHLRTVPNKYESGLSCFQHWHQNDCLKARTYYSIFARSSNRRSAASTDGDSEQRQSPPPRTPPQTPPRTSPTSPPPSPRRTRSRTRCRVSISPESSSESRPQQRRRTYSPEANRFLTPTGTRRTPAASAGECATSCGTLC